MITSLNKDWVSTVITGTTGVSLKSGGNTTLTGAQVNGGAIVADIGGNLNITSLQNLDTYKATSSSMGASIGWSGGAYTGSFNQSNSNTNSLYQSVVTQSGLFAGSGGFQVNVNGNTSLIGGAISSTADTSKNSLVTASLTYSNLQNSANYSATTNGFGISLGTGGKSAANPQGFSKAGIAGNSSSTTNAAVSNGSLVVKNDPASTSGLSRDTAAATNALTPIFNLQRVNETLQLGQEFSKVGMTLVGQLADNLAKKYYDAKGKADSINAYLDLKKKQDDGTVLTDAEKATVSVGDTIFGSEAGAKAVLAEDNAVINDPKNSVWAEGGVGRSALHGVVGGITAGLTGGSITAGVGGAISGEIVGGLVQNEIAKATSGLPVQIRGAVSAVALNVISGTAGSIVGGALGGAQGATAGGQAALAGDQFNRQLNGAETGLIKRAAKGDPHLEMLLWLQACLDVKCTDQMADKDPLKAAINAQLALNSNEMSSLDLEGTLKQAANGFDVENLFRRTQSQAAVDNITRTILNMPGGAQVLGPASNGYDLVVGSDLKTLDNGTSAEKALAFLSLSSNFVGIGEIKAAAKGMLEMGDVVAHSIGKGVVDLVAKAAEVGLTPDVAKMLNATEIVIKDGADFTKIGSTGKIGQDYLEKLGGNTGKYNEFIQTPFGARFVDGLIDGVAHEAKVGEVSLTVDIKNQIKKDVFIAAQPGSRVKDVVWDFFVSPVTGKGGPSGPLAAALKAANIKVVIH